MYHRYAIMPLLGVILYSTHILSSRRRCQQPQPPQTQILVKKTIDEPVLPSNAPLAILFCHGLGGNSGQVKHYEKAAQLPIKFFALDFPYSTRYVSQPFLRTVFGQDEEQQAIIKAYRDLVNQGYRVIVWGVSNGASALIMTTGLYSLKNLAGIIAESPYDDPKIVAEKMLGQESVQSCLWSQGLSSGYDPQGLKPIDVAGNVDKNIPLLFIVSDEDTLIVPAQTKKLYDAEIKTGHTKARLIHVAHGPHANILWGRDGSIYRNGVHAWAKEHGLIP